jgi:outer membrane lipoprotein-sorting protein
MRRVTWMLAIVMCLAVVVAGCGKKDAGSVVKDLEHVIGKLESYQGVGRMVLQTGQQPQEYQVEVWYQNPHFYRISLTNEQKDITQIVLRNDEGVFVLTPHLKKSFRFQSNWPENQGQVYLYHSLVQSILKDNERQFTTDNESYVFDVVGNYQNDMLARQKIWLDQKSLAPQHIEVSDTNQRVMVMVDFTSFEFGKKFEKDSFDMEHNMMSWNMETMPTMAGVDGMLPTGATGANGNTSGGDKNTTTTGATASKGNTPAAKQQSFGVIEPSYLPQDVVKQDITEMRLGEDPAVLLRYKGKYNFSIMEVRPQAKTVSVLPGDIVDLGFTLGVMTGEDKKTLTWTYDTVEYRLSTADLPVSEMIQIAQSVQDQSGK